MKALIVDDRLLSREQALGLGIKHYLAKPIDFQELTTAIRRVMGG